MPDRLLEGSILRQFSNGFLARSTAPSPPDQKHIYFVDESSLASTNQMREFLSRLAPQDRVLLIGDSRQHQGVEAGRPFAPKGQTPIARVVGGTRQKLSMISTVTNQGKTCWEIIDGNFNHERLIEFLNALIKQAGRKVFLVLDNLGVHHSKPVKQWLAEHDEQIEVFHLLSYSPELNPDERLNASLKHAIATKVPMRTKDKLQSAAAQHMDQLTNTPDRVKAFFKDPRVAYAA